MENELRKLNNDYNKLFGEYTKLYNENKSLKQLINQNEEYHTSVENCDIEVFKSCNEEGYVFNVFKSGEEIDGGLWTCDNIFDAIKSTEEYLYLNISNQEIVWKVGCLDE